MIRLFNSLTQRKEEFAPRSEGRVGIYVCGPTVYNLVHVGNARPYVTFAVLRSWLRHRGYEVTLVENITDVDDKIINKAHDEHRSPQEIAAEFTAAYRDDVGKLGEVLRPDVEPLATETIPEIIDLCCRLIERGHAYVAEGSVYFRVRSFAEYGKLSGQRLDELETGARVTREPGKEDPLDFALWKAAKPGEPQWESPWGMGRPGWHIECSAMSLRYLGPGFDIHGGGRDLIFPHHENEIAQSEAAGLPFARYWMHNGMIRSEGEKMAKSVGNIFLLREVLARYEAPVVLMYFLMTHYRSPLEFSVAKLDEARAAYERLSGALRDFDFRVAAADRAWRCGAVQQVREATADRQRAFAEYMDDDLNTAGALGELFGLVGDAYRHLSAVDQEREPLDADGLGGVVKSLTESLEVLLIASPIVGHGGPTPAAATLTGASTLAGRVSGAVEPTTETSPVTLPAAALAAEDRWDEIESLYREALARRDATYACVLRDRARAQKDWARADALRDEIAAAGFEVRDTKQGAQVVSRR